MKQSKRYKDIFLLGITSWITINIFLLLIDVMCPPSSITSWFWYAVFFAVSTLGLAGICTLAVKGHDELKEGRKPYFHLFKIWILVTMFSVIISLLVPMFLKGHFSLDKLIHTIGLITVIYAVTFIYMRFFKQQA